MHQDDLESQWHLVDLQLLKLVILLPHFYSIVSKTASTISGVSIPSLGNQSYGGRDHRWSADSIVKCVCIRKRGAGVHELHPWLYRHTWLHLVFPFWRYKTSCLSWASRIRIPRRSRRVAKLFPSQRSPSNWGGVWSWGMEIAMDYIVICWFILPLMYLKILDFLWIIVQKGLNNGKLIQFHETPLSF